MTPMNLPCTRRPTARRSSAARRPAAAPGRRPAARLVADGVVAAYVQDLSRRDRGSLRQSA
jgi:hypothetical protein